MVQVGTFHRDSTRRKKELLELPELARALGLAAGLRAAQRFASAGRSHGASGALGLRGGRVRFLFVGSRAAHIHNFPTQPLLPA